MEPTALQQIIALASSHGWLPLIMLVTLYARKLLSPASGFPVTIPGGPKMLPIVTAAGGLIYGFEQSVQAGQGVAVAALGAVLAAGSTGFLDSVLTAIFDHDNAPAWARALVFVFDDLTKGGGGTPGSGSSTLRSPGGKAFGAPKTIVVTPPLTPPATTRRARVMFGLPGFLTVFAVALASFAFTGLTGCTSAQWAAFVASSGQFVTYVLDAMQTAEAIWAVIQPLIPASASANATAEYGNAFSALNAAITTYQDAIKAGDAAQSAPPDILTLETSVQSAFAAWVSVIEKWQPLSSQSVGAVKVGHTVGAFADVHALMTHQAQQIAGWK
jgi:hypothetical protein